MTSRRASQAGVTLIELLIGITLMSLLSVAMLYAMRLGLGSQQRANNKIMSNRRVVGSQRILEQQMANLMPVVGACGVGPGAQQIAFFQGDPQAMRFASSFSLEEANRGYPQILEFTVIPGEEGRGVRLVVNELLYSGIKSTEGICVGALGGPGGSRGRFRPVEPSPRSFILADKLASCRFLYRELIPNAPPDVNPENWVTQWAKSGLPTAIRIEMTPLEAGPGSLHVMTVTSPVRITVDPLRKDQF